MSLYQNPLDFQTRMISGGGAFPWMHPGAEVVNDFNYDADVTKLTWRMVGSGVNAPTTRGVNAPGGVLSYTIGTVNDAEAGFQDPGQIFECKPGATAELLVHTALPTPTTIGWMFGWLASQAGTLTSAPQDGIVVKSVRGSAAISIRVYKAGVAEQTITTNAVMGTDPAAIALSLVYADNTDELFVRLAVNGYPALLNTDQNAVKITAAHIPTAALLASGGILQPASGAASINWRLMTVASTVSRFYGAGTFGFGDSTGSGAGSGSGTSSGGGMGSDSIGATE